MSKTSNSDQGKKIQGPVGLQWANRPAVGQSACSGPTGSSCQATGLSTTNRPAGNQSACSRPKGSCRPTGGRGCIIFEKKFNRVIFLKFHKKSVLFKKKFLVCHPKYVVESPVLQIIVQALDMMAKHETVSRQWERTNVNLWNNLLLRVRAQALESGIQKTFST